ncbi:unnamed protein product [Mytilus coruscus]|uniref:CCHC-type domain-containing protein n=1 Tax=Mytilus coruscus TaxID=42192 RepID=A0A6J8A6Z9_MYTCO|nr:unnamed protein product [Mytilus coruscus]
MRHLEERYGDADVMASAFIKKALDWPSIKSGDIKSLDEFALFLVECQYGTESMKAGNVLEYSENIECLMSKLPFHMYDRWRNVVYRVKELHRTVTFNDFVKFVKTDAKKATDPTYGSIAMNYSNSRSTNQRQHGQRVSNVCDAAKNTSTEIHCSYCNGAHELDNCKRLIARPREDRITYLKSKGHCFGCLKKGHMRNKCNRRLKCSICGRLHPTILHNDNQSNKPSSSQQDSFSKNDDPQKSANHEGTQSVVNSSTSSDKGVGDVTCAMAIIPVQDKLNNKSQSVETQVVA